MKALMQTQVAVTLSLNVVTTTDQETQLLTLPLVQLTTLIVWVWAIWQTAYDLGSEALLLASDVAATIDVATKVISIGCKALAFGLGVK